MWTLTKRVRNCLGNFFGRSFELSTTSKVIYISRLSTMRIFDFIIQRTKQDAVNHILLLVNTHEPLLLADLAPAKC
jgi:hypothetical protein